MKKYRTPIGAFLIAAAVVAFLFLRGQGDPEVTVATAELRDIESLYTASGVVQGRSISLSPQVSGRVDAVFVEEGQTVSKGDLLVKLDDKDLQNALTEAVAAEQAASERVAQTQAGRSAMVQEIEARVETARKSLDAARAELDRVLAGPLQQEIAQAELQAEQARARLEQATQSVERARRLYAEGAIARAQLEEAETQFRVADAALDSALAAVEALRAVPTAEDVRAAKANVEIQQANLEAAQAARSQLRVAESESRIASAELNRARAAVESVRSQATNFEITAPTYGVISRLDLESGEFAAAGVPVMVLSAARASYVEIEVSDQDTAKIYVGQEVTVTSGAMPGRTYRGVVESIAPEVELKQDAAVRIRILRANVIVEDPDEHFRVGMELDVVGTGVTSVRTVTVPSDAVFFIDTSAAVWLVENDRVQLQPVEIGFTTFQYTEVVNGLSPGDKVVLRGKDALEDGMSVQIVDD